MSDVVGIELLADGVHAIALHGWRSRAGKSVELAWDPARPADVVALLRDQIGPTRRIALAVGLAFLHLKQVKLPPAPLAERRRMLALEPDRFFPVQDESLVVSLTEQDNLAFAVSADLLESWIRAFQLWAPVQSVEAAPLAVARVLTDPALTGAFALPAGAGEAGVLELVEGRLRSVRRVPQQNAHTESQPLPAHSGVRAESLTALGAARGVDGALDTMLMPEPALQRVQRRRRDRVAIAAAVCVASLVLAGSGLDRARERRLNTIRAGLESISERARPAEQLREQLALLERESIAIGTLSGTRPDPLGVLAALSERIPEDATVLNVKANGADWQIDGTARNAASIVPLLDRDERFENVRFLSASARFRDGNRTYETFSVAFRIRSTS